LGTQKSTSSGVQPLSTEAVICAFAFVANNAMMQQKNSLMAEEYIDLCLYIMIIEINICPIIRYNQIT
jgi:hypothetical protein